MSSEVELVIIVFPVKQPTFKLIVEKNIYYRPAEKKPKKVDYFAFYRTAPVSMVTHLARVGGGSKASRRNI